MRTNQSFNKKRHRAAGSYFTASLFIIAGLLLLGKNFNFIDAQMFSALISWQMLLIALGLFSMINKHFGGGAILIAVGFYFLLPKLGWLSIDPQPFFLPAIFIIVGILLIIKVNRVKTWRKTVETDNQYTSADGVIHSDCHFGSVQQTVMDEVFKGGTIENKFGGTIIDLRRTTLPEGETVLFIECNFGGIEIHIPSHWNIRTEIHPFIGGVEDSRYMAGIIVDTTRTLVIKGNVSIGGVEIKN